MSSVRAVARLHFDAFVRGPMPTLVALGTVCGVVFSRNGLDPRDVPRMLSAGSSARALTIAFIVVLTRATSRAMLFPPGAAYVRASPVSRAVQLSLAAASVLAIQLLWALLFVAGGAPLDGVGLACALAAACIAPTWLELAVALLLGTFAAPIAPLLFAVVLPRAFRSAPVARAATSRFRVRRPWWALLVFAQVRALVRGGATRVGLASSAAAFGIAMVSVASRSERADRAVSLAALIAALGAAPLLAPVARTRRAIAPWVRASTRTRRVPLLIAVAIVAMPSIAFASGAAHLSAHTELAPFSTGVALVAVLVVLHGHLSRRRKDASLVTLPLVAVFTWHARSFAFAAAALGVALVVPEPEVVRADDR